MSKSSFARRALAGAAFSVALAAFGPAMAVTKTTPGGFGQVGSGSQFGSVHGNGNANSLLTSNLVINLAGITSYDAVDDPINTVLTLDALAGSTVDALSWSLSLSTFGESWLSEASILFTNSAGDGVYFAPGFGDDFSGVASYADSVLLADYGLTFEVLSDGKLFVQFYEDYDDNPGAADAVYSAGNLTFGAIGVTGAVPEPATYGLMALGLFAVVGAARRRRAD